MDSARNWKKLKIILSLIALALVFGGTVNTNASADFTGPYEMQNWSSSGILEGTTSISPSSGPATSAEFGYAVSGLPWVSYRTATFSATAAGTGYVTFDWTYTFHHAWYDVYADFYVFADGSSGTTSIHEVDFYNWGYTGPRTFSGSSTIWVEEGYDFGFEIGGSNFDSAGFINGTLTVTNFVAPPVIVEIDIKPGSYPSSINLKSKGAVPVAIHTTEDFDATTVDPETVELEGVAAVNWEIYDCDEVPNPDYGNPLYPDAPEMIGDGDLDLVLYFDTQELADTSALEEGDTEATLTGETFGGESIEGTGDVTIVVQGKP